MKKSYFLLVLVFITHLAFSQVDTVALMNEVKTKLANKSATVSTILTDTSYIVLHPETPFRELIKQYCTISNSRILCYCNVNAVALPLLSQQISYIR
jgi:hypothetical protein